MRTHLRAVCPVCFGVYAVPSGMSHHGYRRPDGWHANVGTCPGVHRAHFGTELGRAIAANHAAELLAAGDAALANAAAIEAGGGRVTRRVTLSRNAYRTEVVDNPTPAERASAARRARADVAGLRANAADVLARVEAWVPAEPVEARVAETVSVLHMSSARMRGGKLCAASFMGAMRGAVTTDRAAVNCPKCLARIARAAERAAAAEGVA